MNRAGWILLFVLIAVCAYATLQKEHMRTASGYTLGPSTNVGDTSYADILKKETGQDTRYGPPTLPTPKPRRAQMSGSAYKEDPPVPPGVTRTQSRSGKFQEPPQCPPRRPFVPGKGCVGSNGKISQPTCFDGAPYIPDPRGMDIGTCGPVPEPRRATQDRAPPSDGPPARYTSEGTPAQIAPAALTGLQVGGPNDGGIGKSSAPGNASWGGNGVKYPNLLGPDNKKSNLPDNNMTANLVLPTPCQVGADGNTLYSPGCRAPTDLGYFTLPTIPKTDGDPSPFSGDYTVFMK